jgi:predicted regulator of Ras-like GTPase activity (Roadblock/LC7/MglB family)
MKYFFKVSFHEILKEMVDRVEGGYAATLVGMDGISVDHYIRTGETCDVEAVCVEYGKIIDEIRKASEVLKLGEVEDVVIASHGIKILLHFVTDEYFLAFVLKSEGNTGKARYFLGRAASKTGKELSR